MLTRVLCFGDSSIEIVTHSKETAELVEMLFKGVPEQGVNPPHARLEISQNRDRDYRLTRDEKEIYKGDSLAALANSLMDTSIFNLADKCSSGLLFHAACLSWKGKGIIMPAQSGHGKTTLSAWLLSNGFDYLTDELVYLPLESRQTMCFGRPLNVKYGAREIIDELLGDNKEDKSIVAGPIAMLVPPRLVRADNKTVEPEVDMVFFPRYRADTEFSLEKLSAAQTGMALMSCLVNARNLAGDGFPATVSLARKVPAYQLTYPSFEGVLGTITGLLDEA
ncbi:MAG: hypothetical protein ACN4GR_16800 [Arenicellales bacterium]